MVNKTKSYINKGNNKITELRTILQRESQNLYVYKQTKSVNNRKTVKTVMNLTWYSEQGNNRVEGRDCVHDKRNISMIICDTDIL